MKFVNAEFENFRNFEKEFFEFEDINIIYGDNANGKTNLIEGLYLFTGAKSFRGAKDSELIKFGAEKSSIKCSFFGAEREQTAQIDFADKKTAYLNEIKKKSVSELGEEIKAVVFSPDYMSLIKDGPSERRRFIDNALYQIKPKYKLLVKEYNRCLLQRNKLLKDCRENNGARQMLFIWNEGLAKYGAKIIFQRKKYIEKITPVFSDIFAGISNGREKAEILLDTGFEILSDDVKEIENSLLTLLEKSENDDIKTKTTSVGPHRNDLEIKINVKNARTFASQGQQRSAVIALKLSEASLLEEMSGVKPIALLDDVMSELDDGRQKYVLNKIKDYQIFITCCDENTVSKLVDGKKIFVQSGTVLR